MVKTPSGLSCQENPGFKNVILKPHFVDGLEIQINKSDLFEQLTDNERMTLCAAGRLAMPTNNLRQSTLELFISRQKALSSITGKKDAEP